MDGALYLKFACAFILVIGMMLLVPLVVRKLGLSSTSFTPGGKRRLKVVEFLPVDHKRKLVLIRRDNREHLVLLGPESETLIEGNIPAADNDLIDLSMHKEQKNAN